MRVIDSGSGISRHLESSIFERSFTTKEKGKGTGLGLSFVKKVIEAHHGKIFVDHSYENTCFVITLPDKKATANRKVAV
ncbi:MAG: ATP-binding protein [Oligoflexales bacterium]